jgi:hypothetical protein
MDKNVIRLAPVINIADLACKRIQKLESSEVFNGTVSEHVKKLEHADRVVNFAHAEMMKQKRVGQRA